MAWTRLIDSSCHDSVTGCGCDETAEQVAARLAEADQLGRAVCDLVGARLAATVPHDGHLLFNPTPAPRTALVRLDVEAPADAAAVGLTGADGGTRAAQVLDRTRTLLADDRVPAADLPAVLTRVHGRELYGQEITAWSVSPQDATLTFEWPGTATRHSMEGDVGPRGSRQPERWRVRIIAAPTDRRRAGGRAGPQSHRRTAGGAAGGLRGDAHSGHGGRRTLDNGLLRVDVADDDAAAVHPDGLTVEGVGRIVDGGDVGDSYNYAPPAVDELIDKPARYGPSWCTRSAGRRSRRGQGTAGRWRRMSMRAHGRWTGRRSGHHRVELRCGERFARLRIDFDNRCDDHRVRLHCRCRRRPARRTPRASSPWWSGG
jgi:alpha-mannosidase